MLVEFLSCIVVYSFLQKGKDVTSLITQKLWYKIYIYIYICVCVCMIWLVCERYSVGRHTPHQVCILSCVDTL